MADAGEADHTQAVHAPTTTRLAVEEPEGAPFFDDLLGDRVVEAAGAPKPHHVPVARDLDAVARHDEGQHLGHPGVVELRGAVGVAHERAAADPGRPSDPAAELEPSLDLEAALGSSRLPARHELAGADDLGTTFEHLASHVGVEHRAHRGCVGVRHVDPADGAVLMRELLEHIERGVHVGFQTAELLGNLEVVEARLGQRLDDGARHGELAVGCVSLRLDQRAQRPGRRQQIGHGAPTGGWLVTGPLLSLMRRRRAVGRRRYRSGRWHPGPPGADRRRPARRGTRRPRSRA